MRAHRSQGGEFVATTREQLALNYKNASTWHQCLSCSKNIAGTQNYYCSQCGDEGSQKRNIIYGKKIVALSVDQRQAKDMVVPGSAVTEIENVIDKCAKNGDAAENDPVIRAQYQDLCGKIKNKSDVLKKNPQYTVEPDLAQCVLKNLGKNGVHDGLLQDLCDMFDENYLKTNYELEPGGMVVFKEIDKYNIAATVRDYCNCCPNAGACNSPYSIKLAQWGRKKDEEDE